MKLKSLLAVLAAVVSMNAQAAGEWRVGVTGGTNSTAGLTLSPSAFTFAIAADYGYDLGSQLQLIGRGSFNTTASQWSIAAGLRYNFSNMIQDAAYLQATIGYGGLSVLGVPANAVNWSAGIGKRFKISDTVAYTPEIGVTQGVALYANVVNFSIWF